MTDHVTLFIRVCVVCVWCVCVWCFRWKEREEGGGEEEREERRQKGERRARRERSESCRDSRRSWYDSLTINVTLLLVKKNSYSCFWESLTTDRHACNIKTLSLSYNMHLFLPYLLNDSQTIHFSKPRLCVTLLFSDWSIGSRLIKQCLCCFVYSVAGKQILLTLQKRHLVEKNEFAFSFRPTSGRGYANSSC